MWEKRTSKSSHHTVVWLGLVTQVAVVDISYHNSSDPKIKFNYDLQITTSQLIQIRREL